MEAGKLGHGILSDEVIGAAMRLSVVDLGSYEIAIQMAVGDDHRQGQNHVFAKMAGRDAGIALHGEAHDLAVVGAKVERSDLAKRRDLHVDDDAVGDLNCRLPIAG
jgi:hypothetical protein